MSGLHSGPTESSACFTERPTRDNNARSKNGLQSHRSVSSKLQRGHPLVVSPPTPIPSSSPSSSAMDPEIQEVPVRSGASEQPEVVVVDSSAGEEPITAAKPALKPNTAQRDDPLEHMEKALENACETLANFTEHVMNFTYESQDLIFKNT